MSLDTSDMGLLEIDQKIEEAPQFKRLVHSVGAPGSVVTISGLLASGGKALLLAALAATIRKPIGYISLESEMDSFAEEVRFFYKLITNPQSNSTHCVDRNPQSVSPQSVVSVPAFDVDPYRGV